MNTLSSGLYPNIPEHLIPIVRTLRTKSERDEARDGITKLEAALFKSDSKEIGKVLNAWFLPETGDAMRAMIEQAEMKKDPGALKAVLKDLREILETLPLLRLSMAFKPREEMIQRLASWTQDNLGSGIILDIGYDGSLVGGVRIIFGGRYKEMTLAQMITDVLAKERSAIKKIIS